MTTYNGRSAQFVPGRETPNKEPPMNRFVIEKLYRVHRERMEKVEPLVDCHVYIPEFMKGSNTWKKNAADARQNRILAENAHMYGRIEKVEKTESLYIKEQRQHIRRMETKGLYLRRLKETDRVHRTMKIQKENEYLLKRIEKAQPSLGRKKMQQWYKYHQMFKDGRRTDPTAGHIMHGMADILPTKLPPLDSVMGSFDRASHALTPGSIYNQLEGDPAAAVAPSRSRSSLRTSSSLAYSTGGTTPLDYSKGQGQQQYSSSSFTLLSSSEGDDLLTRDTVRSSLARSSFQQPNAMMMPSANNSSYYSAGTSLLAGEDSQLAEQSNISFSSSSSQQRLSAYPRASISPSRTSMIVAGRLSEERSTNSSSSSSVHLSGMDKYNQMLSSGSNDLPSSLEPFHLLSSSHRIMSSEQSSPAAPSRGGVDKKQPQQQGDDSSVRSQDSVSGAEYSLLLSKATALPSESKNCLLQVLFRKTRYDEHLFVRVLSTGVSPHVLSERAVPIDAVFEIANLAGHHSQIMHSLENENLSSLSSLLINMFNEADTDEAGSLTFDQFQALMEQVELGISPQELRFVISEADENENGVVDYNEFVPLAVDLIQSFRARNRAKVMYSQKDVELDEVIMKAISSKDLERMTEQCLEKIYEVDAKRYGLIRIPELKRCLNTAAVNAGLRDNEISMICQLLPRDQFDRCKYNTAQPDSFFDILSKVRFMTMKNAMIESQGSGLQKYLLDLCRDEEGRLNEAHEKGTAAITGTIPFRTLINILSNSARLSLSRLQVLVIMSEAHVQEGMINYFQFIPVVAKAIEIMFEPKALRQRAELIERTDLSPEGLIQGMSTDAFEQRLLTLFKSYDIERSGALDQNEFIACLESLDLQLTYAESVALFHSADREHSGMVEFESFISFFTNNLLDLEREKQIRLHMSTTGDDADDDDDGGISTDRDSLPSSVHEEGRSLPSRSSSVSFDEVSSDFIFSVTERCQEMDSSGSGFITFEQFEEVFSEVYTRDLAFSYTSEFLLDFFVSEVRSGADRRVVYKEEIAGCAVFLKRLRLKEIATPNYPQMEESLSRQVDLLVASQEEELLHLRDYLMHLFMREENSSIIVGGGGFNGLVGLLQDVHNGLSRPEANYLVNRFLVTMEDGSGGRGGSGSPLRLRSSVDVDGEELLRVMRYTRKLALMRSALDTISFSGMTAIVGRLLGAEKTRLQEEQLMDSDSHFIPFPLGMKVLEGSRRLLVNLATRIQILAWSDCFDKEVRHLALEKFRDHAANSVCKHNMLAMMKTRADIVSMSSSSSSTGGSFGEKEILSGMTELELLALLEQSLPRTLPSSLPSPSSSSPSPSSPSPSTGQQEQEQWIKYSTFCDALVSLPDINLSEAEIATLASLFSIKDDLVSFNSSTSSRDLRRLVFSITTLCRERHINRRMALHVVSSQSQQQQQQQQHGDGLTNSDGTSSPDNKSAFAMRVLKKEYKHQLQGAAEKLLAFTKLTVQSGDVLCINLPIDSNRDRDSNSNSKKDKRAVRKRSSMKASSSCLDQTLLDDNVLAFSERPVQWSRLRAHQLPSKPSTPSMTKVVISSSRAPTSSKAGGQNNLTRSSVSKLSAAAADNIPIVLEYEKVETLLKSATLTISIHEDLQTLSETQLVCRCVVRSSDDADGYGGVGVEEGGISAVVEVEDVIVTALNVKLPSLALVDRDAAVEFACNLMGKIYVEEVIDKSTELKIYE